MRSFSPSNGGIPTGHGRTPWVDPSGSFWVLKGNLDRENLPNGHHPSSSKVFFRWCDDPKEVFESVREAKSLQSSSFQPNPSRKRCGGSSNSTRFSKMGVEGHRAFPTNLNQSGEILKGLDTLPNQQPGTRNQRPKNLSGFNLEKIFLHGFPRPLFQGKPSARNASPFLKTRKQHPLGAFFPSSELPFNRNLWNVFFQETPFVVKVGFPHGIHPFQNTFIPNDFMKIDNNYQKRNSQLDRLAQLRKNMAYFAPEKNFLMDREEIKALEQIINDVCGSTQPMGAALFEANEEDGGPLPWRRIEIAVDSMLAEISYRATRLHAIQFGAHLKTRPSFPEITYDSTHHDYINGEFVQREPGEKHRMKGNGEFEEGQYFGMGFNPYDLSDPLYESKFRDIFKEEFWKKALSAPFVQDVPKPSGPPYLLHSYNSNAEAVMNQVIGRPFLNTVPFFFPDKDKRVIDNFTPWNAPLKGNGEESPKMRFLGEVEALQQARLDFVTGLVPRAWGARMLLEQEAHEKRAFGPVVPLEAGDQERVYDSTVKNKNYYYPFGSLTFTPDFKTEKFKSPLEHQDTYCDLGLKNLLKTTSVYQILMNQERTMGVLDHENALHHYKESVLRQSSDETPRDFPLKLCRMLHIRTLEASAEVLSFKGHQGSAFAPVSQYLENIQDFLRESKTSPYVFTGKVVRDSVYSEKKKGSDSFREENMTTFHRMSQEDPSVLRHHSNDLQFLPLWFRKKDFILRYSDNKVGVKGWPKLLGVESKDGANNARYIYGYGPTPNVEPATQHSLDGHYEMAFNRLFLGPLQLQKRYRAWNMQKVVGPKKRWAMKHAWPGREGDAGGFEYEMLRRILMENHLNQDSPHMPFLFDGHSNAPHSTENAQYMALATFPSAFQRLVLLCQEALLGPASYLVKGSKFSTRQGSHDGTRTRFTGFFYGTSVLFMRQNHRNRLNLTNFQRYLLRLGLNFVKTPTNEGTLYASQKNLEFMATERNVKKKDGTMKAMKRSLAPLGPVSQRILKEGPIRDDFTGLENSLSFSFLGVRFHHWTGMYPLVEDAKKRLKKNLPARLKKGILNEAGGYKVSEDYLDPFHDVKGHWRSFVNVELTDELKDLHKNALRRMKDDFEYWYKTRHAEKEYLHGRNHRKVTRMLPERGRRILLKRHAQIISGFATRLGYLDIYNKDGCQNQLQWDLVTLQHDADAITFLDGRANLLFGLGFESLVQDQDWRAPNHPDRLQKLPMRSWFFRSTENPAISHWSHSYLNYLPYSQWTAYPQSAPKLLSEEEHKWKVMENLQPCVNSLQAPSFYGIRYEKVDGTADGYFFFGKKALAFKTQEELLRPLYVVKNDTTDKNPYRHHYFIDSFMANRMEDEKEYLEEERQRALKRQIKADMIHEHEEGWIHPYNVLSETEKTMISLENIRLHLQWHPVLQKMALRGLHRNFDGSFQKNMLGFYPHHTADAWSFLVYPGAYFDSGPVDCVYSGATLSRDSVVSPVKVEKHGRVVNIASLLARDYAAFQAWSNRRALLAEKSAQKEDPEEEKP